MTTNLSIILDVGTKAKKETNFDASKFAVWLRDARENSKPYLNQSELAKQVNVVRQRISELEGGDKPALPKLPSKPGLDLVEAIAVALNVDVNEARLAAGYLPMATEPKSSDAALLRSLEEISSDEKPGLVRNIKALIKAAKEAEQNKNANN